MWNIYWEYFSYTFVKGFALFILEGELWLFLSFTPQHLCSRSHPLLSPLPALFSFLSSSSQLLPLICQVTVPIVSALLGARLSAEVIGFTTQFSERQCCSLMGNPCYNDFYWVGPGSRTPHTGHFVALCSPGRLELCPAASVGQGELDLEGSVHPSPSNLLQPLCLVIATSGF